MKTLAALIALIWSVSGCALITQKVNPDARIDQVIYSEAGGVATFLTGKVSSCTIVRSNETAMEIVKFVFDEDTCSVELQLKAPD